MQIQQSRKKWVLVIIPFTGILLFILLYLLAALLYPGGSQVNSNSKGFSWLNNYWCNLLNYKAINGEYNAGRNAANFGMFILAATLSVF